MPDLSIPAKIHEPDALSFVEVVCKICRVSYGDIKVKQIELDKLLHPDYASALARKFLSYGITDPIVYDPIDSLNATQTCEGLSLTEIFNLFGSDKRSYGHNYGVIYERYLRDIRSVPITMAEIGVRCGASQKSFASYFNSAKIYAADIDLRCAHTCSAWPNIEVKIMDARVSSVVEGQVLDVFIDDGSHISRDILAAFELNFRCLRPGGHYFIEDTHCTWSPGYLAEPTLSQRNKADFSRSYFSCLLDLVTRLCDEGAIEFVHYYKSFAVIRKSD